MNWSLIPTCGLHCGENRVGLEPKQAVIGVYWHKDNELRSAVNVSECRYNETGALLGCRFQIPRRAHLIRHFSHLLRRPLGLI